MRIWMRLEIITMGLLTLSLAPFFAATAAAQDPKLVEQGAKLFVDQKCSLCHSVAGKGNQKGPMEEHLAKVSAADIREWIVNAKEMTAKTKSERKPEMKAYTLEKGDVDALVAYLMSVKKK